MPCSMKRHVARRNEAHKHKTVGKAGYIVRRKPESSYGRATIKATYA